jgi:hypothetical protein
MAVNLVNAAILTAIQVPVVVWAWRRLNRLV